MKHIWTLFRKEIDRLISDRSMLFGIVLLPGIIIFLVYGFMGSSLNSEQERITTHQSRITIYNAPETFKRFLSNPDAEITLGESLELAISYRDEATFDEVVENNVLLGFTDAVLVFSSNFETEMREDALVNIYYNSTKGWSSVANQKLQHALSLYRDFLLEEELGNSVNLYELRVQTIEDERKVGTQMLAALLPILLISFVFSGAISIGSDAIAGEKERGTLASLLMAPIQRHQIVIGKIISISAITVLSALSSFAGILASLPFSKALYGVNGNVSLGFMDLLMLLILILTLVLVMVSLIAVASTLAKTVKEASTFAMPMYFIALISAAMSMFSESVSRQLVVYVIPVYSNVMAVRALLMFELDWVQFMLTIVSSIGFFTLMVLLITRLFHSENVLFKS